MQFRRRHLPPQRRQKSLMWRHPLPATMRITATAAFCPPGCWAARLGRRRRRPLSASWSSWRRPPPPGGRGGGRPWGTGACAFHQCLFIFFNADFFAQNAPSRQRQSVPALPGAGGCLLHLQQREQRRRIRRRPSEAAALLQPPDPPAPPALALRELPRLRRAHLRQRGTLKQ